MEFVMYVQICITGFAILFAIPAFIWLAHDNKRRELAEQEREREEADSSASAR